jgi:hypothetical protein
VGYENKTNERGERLIWLDPAVVARLRAMRGPGESYSDVILKLVGMEGRVPELWPKVGEGVNRGRRHIVGVFEPPLLHRRSDMPCPTITLSN